MQWVSEVTVGGRTEKSVLIALANFHNVKNDECFPSIDTISSFLEMNRKTVMPALDRLQEMGFISFEKGSRKHRKYTLHFDVLSPKGGTKGKRDYSSNLGTKDEAVKSQNEPVKSPNTGTKESNLKVPKQDSYSPKTDALKSQPLDHEQCNSLNSNTPLVVPPTDSGANSTDLLGDPTDLPGAPKRFIAKDFPLPPEINHDAWLAFCEHRSLIRKPLKEHSAKLTIAELSKYSQEVQLEAVKQSAQHGWQGVFPDRVKAQSHQGSTRRTTLEDDLTDTSWAD